MHYLIQMCEEASIKVEKRKEKRMKDGKRSEDKNGVGTVSRLGINAEKRVYDSGKGEIQVKVVEGYVVH
ncbi:hypothetical protein GCK72_009644 [Caenorhabditis remanei]|uniref:Uncharacterized protein n=1 Tax=Caenorhabditis remanei TaxID=31234 RepID=A0A6A5H0Y7_CAERE|nr:hypothetical protein GCK72_009644 [Caenorhabditis remanei]KAF1761388.1 hypothetical protein GCK72_009644 [Caenorhabditis remanei]